MNVDFKGCIFIIKAVHRYLAGSEQLNIFL